MKKIKNVGIVGAIFAGLLCIAPIWVVLFGALGVGWLAGYMEVLFIPIILVSLGLIGYAVFANRKNPEIKETG